MKTLSWLIVLFLFSESFASGTYGNRSRPSSYSSRPSRPASSSTSSSISTKPFPAVEARPYKKSEKSLKSFILKFKANGLTINSVSLSGDFFTIEGSYRKKAAATKLVEYIKSSDSLDREVELSSEKDSWPGSIYYNYKIKAKNIWK